MARKADAAGGDGKKVSKATAYRDAEKTLGKTSDLDSVHDFLLENYNIDMKKTQISQYRSNEKKRKGTKPKKRGRKPKSFHAAPASNAAPKTSAPKSDTLVDFVSAVRYWENKIGSEQICDMIDALYKVH